MTAALPLVADGRKKSGVTATAKVAALLSSAAVPSSDHPPISVFRTRALNINPTIIGLLVYDRLTSSFSICSSSSHYNLQHMSFCLRFRQNSGPAPNPA